MVETWMQRNFNQNSHEHIATWVKAQDAPFDHTAIAKANDCTPGYAAATLRRYFAGHMRYIRRHVGSGNFRVTYFPLGWTSDQCRAWMDGQTKSGKSKAGLCVLK